MRQLIVKQHWCTDSPIEVPTGILCICNIEKQESRLYNILEVWHSKPGTSLRAANHRLIKPPPQIIALTLVIVCESNPIYMVDGWYLRLEGLQLRRLVDAFAWLPILLTHIQRLIIAHKNSLLDLPAKSSDSFIAAVFWKFQVRVQCFFYPSCDSSLTNNFLQIDEGSCLLVLVCSQKRESRC